jgi:hypothetical protein
LVYWPLPIWVFAALYALVFAYALALLWLVPTRRLGSEVGDRVGDRKKLRTNAYKVNIYRSLSGVSAPRASLQ